VIVLGKETVAVTVRGKKVFTVPVLLECRNEEDKGELYEILREAEYFGTYHWPMEMLDFVKTVRENLLWRTTASSILSCSVSYFKTP
jgi:hypothetical protein